MPKTSAGLLMYRHVNEKLEVLLVHPGGPFWKKKDMGAWAIPKGEVKDNEDLFAAAQREFLEETGFTTNGPYIDLGEIRHRSGKRVHVWAFGGDCDPTLLRSNTFEMEWPPKSGKRQTFPEVDKASFYSLEDANEKILEAEAPFLDRLREKLSSLSGGAK
jgi:predicted NUDIX family NTP pyrophosphohydrolase